jgi:hypothetical protein
MKRLLILGSGTAGTMVANKLRRRLPVGEWAITIVDQDSEHHYQPGYLLIPFGVYDPSTVVKPRKRFLPRGVNTIIGTRSTTALSTSPSRMLAMWSRRVASSTRPGRIVDSTRRPVVRRHDASHSNAMVDAGRRLDTPRRWAPMESSLLGASIWESWLIRHRIDLASSGSGRRPG